MRRTALLLVAAVLAACGGQRPSGRSDWAVPLVEDAATGVPEIATAPDGRPSSGSAAPSSMPLDGTAPEASDPSAPATNATDSSTTPGSAPGAAPPSAGERPGTTTGVSTSDGKASGRGDLAPLVLGIHTSNSGAALTAAGISDGDAATHEQIVRSLVDDLNARGGIGGRLIEPVIHVTDSLRGSFSQQIAEACADFTDDHHVDLVLDGALVPRFDMSACLAQHDVPMIWEYGAMVDRATLAPVEPYLFMPSMPLADDLGVSVDLLFEHGFLTADSKVGLLRFDDAASNRFARNVLEPGLRRLGLAITEEFAYSPASGASDAGTLATQSGNAVVRMRSRGVDRIIFVPSFAVLPVLWWPAAESQGYEPKYAMFTYDTLGLQVSNASDGQLDGSMAIGWAPAGDTTAARKASAWDRHCTEVTGEEGFTAHRYCNGFVVMEQAFRDLRDTSSAAIRAALESLGEATPSALTFSSQLGKGRHLGARQVQAMTYASACNCFEYVGTRRSLP